MSIHDAIAYYLIGAGLVAGATLAQALMDGGSRGLLGWVASLLIAVALGCAWPFAILLIVVGLRADRRKRLEGEV